MPTIFQNGRKIKLILYLVSLAFLLFYGLRLATPAVSDEIGTMSNTAFLTGYDWSTYNRSAGNFYYKYFQALLYIPFFLLIKNPFTRYRAIMALHAALMSLVPVIAYTVACDYLKVDTKKAVWMGLAVGTIPAAILNAQCARADMLLIVLPWMTLLALLRSFDAADKRNERRVIRCSILAAFFAVAAYMSHTRGIVVLIAALLLIYGLLLVRKVRIVNSPAFLITSAVLLVLDKLISAYLKKHVWPYGAGHASFEAFDFAALKLIFTPAGLKSMVKLVVGWAFSALTSTYGLVAVGVAAFVLVLLYSIRKKYDITLQELIVVCFGGLNFLGNTALGLLFFFKPLHSFFLGKSTLRGDRVIYGRYMASGFGVICLIALYTLLCRKEWLNRKGKAALLILDAGVLAVFMWKVAETLQGATIKTRNITELCTFLTKDSPGKTSGVFSNITGDLLYAGCAGLIAFLVLICFSIGKRSAFLLAAVVVLVNAVNLDICFNKVSYALEKNIHPSAQEIYEVFDDLSELDEEYRNVYLGKGLYIQRYQMELTEFKVFNRKMPELLELENEFLILKNGAPEADNSDLYLLKNLEKLNGDFSVYVKGEELKRELEEMGYTLAD